MDNLEQVKEAVRQEFMDRKTREPLLKLGHVYDEISRRAGYKSWNEYSSALKRSECL